ncbi:MAG TPA: hypothetical protein VNB94_05520 [Mycobacteriales bacterium]|nr:hypothetical protein [Mycobacteriales bacterium]
MAYVTIMEFDADWETHLKIDGAVGEDLGKGLIVHASGRSDAGVRSIDIWESKEASERFYVERILPALESLGIPGGPPLSTQDFDVEILRVS